MNRSADLENPEEGITILHMDPKERQKKGWPSRRELQIAIDAKGPIKNEPSYLRHANERAVARLRAEAAPTAGVTAFAIVVPVRQDGPERPRHVIDVEPT